MGRIGDKEVANGVTGEKVARIARQNGYQRDHRAWCDSKDRVGQSVGKHIEEATTTAHTGGSITDRPITNLSFSAQ